MLARGPQSPLGTLFMVCPNVGVLGGFTVVSHGLPFGFAGGSAVCSGGGASAALMSVKGASKGVLVSIGVGFLGGRLVDFAIYFSTNTCICRARWCAGVPGCSIA